MSKKDPALEYEPHRNNDEAKAAECSEDRGDHRDSRMLGLELILGQQLLKIYAKRTCREE